MAASAWHAAPARSLEWLADERLARLAARGDQRAFGALYERHQAGLTRYCRTILRNGADAEDAAQNAMVSALRALESGTTPIRVKPWLYRIAHHEAIDLVRTRKPAEELDETTLSIAAAGNAEEATEVRQRLGQLMADLQALTDRQREALVLRELCGMEYAEIAQTLGSSQAAAQQTVFEARSALLQFGEGRALDCEGVQRAMSECDGMRLRTRKVRAHVRGCACCESFEASLLARRRDLGLLFPPTGAATGLLAALARFFGGGGGEPLLAGLGLKGVAVGLAVLAGGGAVVATSVSGGGHSAPAPAGPAAAALPSAASAAGASGSGAGSAKHTAGAKGAKGKGPKGKGGGKHAASTGPGSPAASGTPGATSAGQGGAAGGGVTHVSEGSGSGPGSGAGSGSGTAVDNLPAGATAPSPVSQTVHDAGQAVSDTTQAAGQAVQDTAQQVTDTANDAVGPVTDAVQGATGTAQQAAGDVAGTVGGAVSNLPQLP